MSTFACAPPRPEIRWDVTDADYYADHSAVSQSMLKTYVEKPLKYEGIYVSHRFPPDAETDALRIGKAFHMAVLEPDRFRESVIAAPKCDRRTKEGKALFAAFCEASAGKVILSQEELANVQAMADGVFVDDTARDLLEKPREVELPLRWLDAESGIECKAKLDALIADSFSFACVLDLKSSKDPTPTGFAKSAIEYGYDRQAAVYCRAASLFTGKPAIMAFIAVRSEVPYDCWVYKLSADAPPWMQTADRRLSEELAALKHARDTNYWFAPGQHSLNTLVPPGWALERLGLR